MCIIIESQLIRIHFLYHSQYAYLSSLIHRAFLSTIGYTLVESRFPVSFQIFHLPDPTLEIR